MLELPISTDPLNNPSHSKMHRVIAINNDSPDQSIVVESNGNVSITGNISAPNLVNKSLAIALAIAL